MTPNDYLKIQAEQDRVIDAAHKMAIGARNEASKCPPPKNLRPAVASDIKPGAVIWYPDRHDEGSAAWSVVHELRHYGDDFKAYIADDGCRYGLAGAFVESQ